MLVVFLPACTNVNDVFSLFRGTNDALTGALASASELNIIPPEAGLRREMGASPVEQSG